VRDGNPFRRDGEGFVVELPTEAREVLAAVAAELRGVLTGETAADDPAVARLFPTAYPDDPARNLGFEHVAGEGLQLDRLASIDTLEATSRSRWLTEEQLLAWMRAVNDARLVLGVRLDVTEASSFEDHAGDPATAHAFSTYAYLSGILEAIVEALGDPTAAR
jgi:hypothetical protein